MPTDIVWPALPELLLPAALPEGVVGPLDDLLELLHPAATVIITAAAASSFLFVNTSSSPCRLISGLYERPPSHNRSGQQDHDK
jgi:hypothetical protein